MIPFLPELSVTPLSAAPLPKTLAGGTGAGAGEAEGAGRPALDFAGLLDAVLPGAAQALPGAVAESGAPAAPAPDLVPVMRPLGPLTTGAKASDDALPAPVPPVLPPVLPSSGTSLPDSGSDLPPAGTFLPPPQTVAALVVPSATAGMSVESTDDAEAAPALPEAAQPEAALLALLPAALPAPVMAPAPARAGAAADPARPVPAAAPAPAAPVTPAAGLPALPVSPAEEEAPAGPAPASAAPEPAAQAAASTAAAPAPQPSAPVSAQNVPQATPAPIAERAEPRAVAPQQESAIAQVGEIREALRSVRPEMTLRHAEFGFVSLRIEGTTAAPQDWRAVLASRDPGFVPAIQAALAERAVSASADSAATGGQTGSGSGADRQYGFSQGSGQGSSQPYFGQSEGRDEGAESNPRNPQQRRAGDGGAAADGAPESEASGQRPRGLFA